MPRRPQEEIDRRRVNFLASPWIVKRGNIWVVRQKRKDIDLAEYDNEDDAIDHAIKEAAAENMGAAIKVVKRAAFKG